MEQFAANVTGEDHGVLDEGRPLLFNAFLRFEKELPITGPLLKRIRLRCLTNF